MTASCREQAEKVFNSRFNISQGFSRGVLRQQMQEVTTDGGVIAGEHSRGG
jgi:hypothetical protein